MTRTFALICAGAATSLALSAPVRADSFDDASTGKRALYVTGAILANVVPGVSALASPRCLPGYLICKVSFAAIGLIAGTEQLLLGLDPKAFGSSIERGFGGDWVVTPHHIARGTKAQPYPDPPSADTGDVLPDF